MVAEKEFLFDSEEYFEFGYKAPSATVVVEVTPKHTYKSVTCRFMTMFFNKLISKEVRENWRNFREYFSIIKDFT